MLTYYLLLCIIFSGSYEPLASRLPAPLGKMRARPPALPGNCSTQQCPRVFSSYYALLPSLFYPLVATVCHSCFSSEYSCLPNRATGYSLHSHAIILLG